MADSGSSNTSMQSDVGALRAAAAAGDAEAMLHISASLLSSFPFPSFLLELRAEVSSYHLLASIIQGNVYATFSPLLQGNPVKHAAKCFMMQGARDLSLSHNRGIGGFINISGGNSAAAGVSCSA